MALAACSPDAPADPEVPQVVVETIGDTAVVRTLSGSVWGAEATLVPEVSIGELNGAEEYLFGNIYGIAVDGDGRVYVLDGQAQDIRVFDSDGNFIATVTRRGVGPGELRNAMSVAVLSDGRVVAHEPTEMLVKVAGPTTVAGEHWSYPQGAIVLPVKPLRLDRSGRILVATAGTTAGGRISQYVIAMSPDGELLDSLYPPGTAFEPPSLELRFPYPVGGRSSAAVPVPFTARHYWTMHPNGHFVTGISSDYSVNFGRDEGVLRIERTNWEPVGISEAERGYHRERLAERMRVTQSDWDWNGPPIPDTKRAFRGLEAGRDGRIWVELWTEARPVVNEDHNPDDPRSQPVTWESPVRYDAFEPDGTYLGMLAAPDGFLTSPATPIFEDDRVWAVTRDDLEVQRVVRYRIVVGRN